MHNSVKEKLLTPEQIKTELKNSFNSYMRCKYVRFADGTFLFIDDLASLINTPSHRHMASGREDEVVSAGYIQVYSDKVWVGEYSSTLDKGPALDDDQLISEMFGLSIMDYRGF